MSRYPVVNIHWISGYHPVQAEGTIDGQTFFYRDRSGERMCLIEEDGRVIMTCRERHRDEHKEDHLWLHARAESFIQQTALIHRKFTATQTLCPVIA